MSNLLHVKIHAKGTAQQLHKFHALLKQADNDWPYLQYKTNVEVPPVEGDEPFVEMCGVCGGLVYERPMLVPNDVKVASKQAGLRSVKVRRWADAGACLVHPAKEKF